MYVVGCAGPKVHGAGGAGGVGAGGGEGGDAVEWRYLHADDYMVVKREHNVRAANVREGC